MKSLGHVWFRSACLAASAGLVVLLVWWISGSAVNGGAGTPASGSVVPQSNAPDDVREVGTSAGVPSSPQSEGDPSEQNESETDPLDSSKTAAILSVTVITLPLNEEIGEETFRLVFDSLTRQEVVVSANGTANLQIPPNGRRGSLLSCCADGYESLAVPIRFASSKQPRIEITLRPRRLCRVTAKLALASEKDDVPTLAGRKIEFLAGRSWLLGDPPAAVRGSPPGGNRISGGPEASNASESSGSNDLANAEPVDQVSESTTAESPGRRWQQLQSALSRGVHLEAFTRDDGVTEFGKIPEGTEFYLGAHAPGFRAVPIRAVATYPGTDVSITARIVDAATVTVLDDGVPVNGAVVRAVSESPKRIRLDGRTDGDGIWWFEPPSVGEYTFVALGQQGARSASHRQVVEEGLTEVRVELQDSPKVEARFIDQFGVPIESLSIELWGWDFVFGASGRTDSQGVVSLSVPVSESRVLFKVASGLSTDQASSEFTTQSLSAVEGRQVSLPAASRLEYQLERRVGTEGSGGLRIRFVPPIDIPLETRVQVDLEYLTWSAGAEGKLGALRTRQVVASVGGWSAETASGMYSVSARVAHRGREYGGEVAGIRVIGGQETLVNVTLTPIVPRIDLHLILPDGTTLNTGRVLVNGRRITPNKFLVAANGIVTLSDLPSGEHIISLVDAAFILPQSNAYRLTVDSRQSVEPVRIHVLETPIQVRMKIPESLDSARLVATSLTTTIRNVHAEEVDDEWLLRGLAPGTWTIIVKMGPSFDDPIHAHGLIDIANWDDSHRVRIEDRRVVADD